MKPLNIILILLSFTAAFYLFQGTEFSQTEGQQSLSSKSKNLTYRPFVSKQTYATPFSYSKFKKPNMSIQHKPPYKNSKPITVRTTYASRRTNLGKKINGNFENLNLKAIHKSKYNSSLGQRVGAKGNFVLFKTSKSYSTLDRFSISSLPIIASGNSLKTGVVTGKISVKFKIWPVEIKDLEKKFNLSLISTAKRINTSFFSFNENVNIFETLKDLKRENNIKHVELEIQYAGVTPQ